MKIKKILIALIFCLLPLSISAQWSQDPTVNNLVNNSSGDQTDPQLVSDGNDGAIVLWIDDRNGYNDLYLQRFL